MTKLRQAELADGDAHMVTWIPAELCRKGRTLVDKAGREWLIVAAYTIEIERSDIHQDWKVGGLNA